MSYDVFLSHSHVDKECARALHDFISEQDYFARSLRVWLDVRVLDPGNLSSERELESALERSRRLILILSNEALTSPWVKHEIDFFLSIRDACDILLIRLSACSIPDQLSDCQLVDWEGADEDQTKHKRVLQFVTPFEDNSSEHESRHTTRKSLGNARFQLPQGYQPRPTEASQKILQQMTRYDIGNLNQEGLALAGFDTAAQFIKELDDTDSYTMRMVLGEIIALCILRNPAYAQIARNYVEMQKVTESGPSFVTLRNRALRAKSATPSTTNLLFIVARSASKLALIDASCVDLSTLAELLMSLDQSDKLDKQHEVLVRMMVRVLGKLRSCPVVELLIYALVKWGGNASHLTAAGTIAISYDGKLDSDDFYLQEFTQLTNSLPPSSPVPPPSPVISRLLFEPYSELGTNVDLIHEIRVYREEYIRHFGQPAEDNLMFPKSAPTAIKLVNGPVVGRITQVTLANMESLADKLGPADIACLSEPRIVDALFENAGAFLINENEVNAPLGNRLHRRGVRYASFATSILQTFEDGSALVLWPSLCNRPPAGLILHKRVDLSE